MSKRFRIILAVILLSTIGGTGAGVAQQPIHSKSVKPAAANTTVISEVIAATKEILEQVSILRGLEILSPVKSGVKSRSEIENEIIEDFEESYRPDELDAVNKSLIAYGLVPADFNYRDFMTRLLTEQVAGFYRPRSKELFIADWNDINIQKPVMAHELTHALQDQHFDLQRFDKWPNGDGDREAAIHALIEGDAMGVMYTYQMAGQTTGTMNASRADITLLPSFSHLGDQAMMEAEREGQKVFLSAPAVIRESLIFPYVYGAGFVQELVRHQGWAGVSRAFTELPQSTEQIIHYNKYAERELPIKVKLPDVSEVLGPGWNRVDSDVNGEFGYYLILNEFIGKKEARKAAEGWGGDHSTLYQNKNSGQMLIAHLSVWDTVKDAEEFLQAYTKRLGKRYPGAAVMKQAKGTLRRTISYESDAGKALIEIRDRSALVLELLNISRSAMFEPPEMQKILDALWKQQ